MLITFEGTEGSGKSTLIQNLSLRLKRLKISHIVTREPGGSSVAEAIRSVIFHQAMTPLTELFLYEAARAEHFEKTILPALSAKKTEKKIVLCDRFTDSTFAYQGYARGINLKLIHQLNQIATQGHQPDFSFLIDIPVEVGLARAQDPNRFEKESLAFHDRVKKGFLARIKKNPRRWYRVKTLDKNPQQICDEVFVVLEKLISQKKKKKK